MKEESISARQLFYLVLLMQIGTRVLSLPYDEAQYAGSQGWMAVLLGGLIAQANIVFLWWLGKRHPDQNLFQYVHSLTGKPIGFLFTVVYALYFTLSALVVSVIYIEILNRWVLPQTPWSVLLLLFFVICGYAAMSSLRVLTSISHSLIYIVIAGYILVLFSGVKEGDIRNVMPLFNGGGSSFAQGIMIGWSACLGYDLLLYVFPFVKSPNPKKILGAMTWANGLTTLFYLTVVFICSLNFTPEQTSRVPEPIVFIMKQIKWETVQSLDIVFITLWLTVIAATVFVYLHLAAKAVCHVGGIPKGNSVVWVWICTGICFAIGLWLPDRKTIEEVTSQPYNIYSLICVVAIPLLLLTVSKFSSREGRT